MAETRGYLGPVTLLGDLTSPATWKRLLFLALALPLGIFYFAFLVTALSTGLGMAITLLGIPVLVGAMYAWREFARMERGLIGKLLDAPIADPYRATGGQTFWQGLRTRLLDPATWKDLFYLLLSFPLSLATFVLTTTVFAVSLGMLFAPTWYWSIDDGIELGLFNADTLPEALALVPLGAALTLLAFRAVHPLAGIHAAFGRLMLGSEPDPELTARVHDLRSSRARVLAAADAERRRLERALHDGAQQRLVSLSLNLSMVRKKLDAGEHADLEQLVTQAGSEAEHALQELRDLARGLHPAILTNRGLGPALEDLARRSEVPVEVLEAPDERLPEPVEATAYFLVSEALTNMAKYANASKGTVFARVYGNELVVEVTDDGQGGAHLGDGSGLSGLDDRLSALDGNLHVSSPPGEGTTITARMPAFEAPDEVEEAPRAPASPAELMSWPASQRRARRREAFRHHAALFVTIQVLLVAIWALTGGGYFWPVWPLLGWGAVFALHGWLAMASRPALSEPEPRPAPR
jgi:signal transduction histidine kinase